MATDPLHKVHLEWLGYVQPVGLVVSAPALTAAQAYPNKNILAEHRTFVEKVEEVHVGDDGADVPAVRNIEALLVDVLGWEPDDLAGSSDESPIPPTLEVALPEYGETLRPTYAVWDGKDDESGRWMMLIQKVDLGLDLDKAVAADDRGWQASPQAKFERLLRETCIPTGLLFNGTHLRLVYAPKGETSGYITFPIHAMAEVAGRPIFAAMQMLLSGERLFSLADHQRLPALLADSRKWQSFVSTRLSEQVLAALYELLRGFQAADDLRKGTLLRDVLREDPNQVYNGLLTVLMRLVFILYAEDRGLMSADQTYVNHYSVGGLFERLRADAGRYPDTMDQRYGAWTQLLTLFRLIHDGGSHGELRLPARRGYLFDPDRYPFLEGGRPAAPPSVSDGVVYRALENLMVLDGERLSYRSLDVEQIGSVYETMMGFNLEVAKGPSIAVKAATSRGAPTTIDLAQLLKVKGSDRTKWLRDKTDQMLTGEALKAARTVEDLVAALGKKVAREATPNIAAPGAMVLQPNEERRRSGSHYTPRSLTAPIVEKTLRPVLEQFGPKPTPDQILGLNILDPAMGSGAFLVEACRQLGEVLVKSWHEHRCLPKIPPDEDEQLHAQRLVAQRCLYGVDKNPMAVGLAKLSLWLATLSKDHPFTFLDHALRCGDSLVGLTVEQIGAFHWEPEAQAGLVAPLIKERLAEAMELRARIRQAGEAASHAELTDLLTKADRALDDIRLIGDAAVAAFFEADNPKVRQVLRSERSMKVHQWLKGGKGREEIVAAAAKLLVGDRPVLPFHWQIEFPEVFAHGGGGFDVIIGNPPFLGGSRISTVLGEAYRDWLPSVHEGSHGNGDLVAHFFRRAFGLLRPDGCFGLIATKTIRQGDTRATGLRWICTHGTIYNATRRIKWPGSEAAVVVSVVHIMKGACDRPIELDGRKVPAITAFLFYGGGNDNPAVLQANADLSFEGSKINGTGFTFDDTDKKGAASPVAEMYRFVKKDPRNAERIFPYIGGEEVNDSPEHAHHRYVINFEEMGEDEARRWPDLMKILQEKVKPERDSKNNNALRDGWWQYERSRPGLYAAIRGMKRVLTCCRHQHHWCVAVVPGGSVFADSLDVFALETSPGFCMLQSRPHEVWARFFASTMKDDLRYTPSDCFETFPFPEGFEKNVALEAAGKAYYEFRAALMVKNDEGLTKTYNRFHDPDETSHEILKLRDLHAAMDRAVLDAYGWTDLKPTCEFKLDYEEDGDDEEGATSRRKKPWRYRWTEEFHDEVLARLLDMNRRRAEQEALTGMAAAGPSGKRQPKRGRKKKPAAEHGESLFKS